MTLDIMDAEMSTLQLMFVISGLTNVGVHMFALVKNVSFKVCLFLNTAWHATGS